MIIFAAIMRRILSISIVLFSFLNGFAQANYPKDYFRSPLEVPLILSGTFGELRTNHFHGGLDIKTQQREGLNVVGIADGYVSRIKIQHWGYGKALYVTHPNGYTSVYGHLKKFAPEIEMYVKKHQYAKESYTLELFPKANELKVEKGKLIAYSGNSGSSGGPHVHFEIRDGKSNPINPMFFGIDIPDSQNPLIRAGVVYSFGDSTHVDGTNDIKELIIKNKNGNLVANPIEAYGKIGIGVNAVDKLDGALNNNGIFNLQMTVNGKKVYEHEVNTFSFAETRYINTLVDYERYYQKRQKIQKCFVEPSNKLSIYRALENNGYINIEDGLSYNIEVIAKDFKGNITKLIIPIKGKKADKIVKKAIEKTPHFFRAYEFNKLNKENVSVAFPKNSFYKDIYFDFDYDGKIVKLHNGGIPLHRNFTLTFDISDYPAKDKKQVIIASINKKGRLSYASTKRKDNKLYTLSRSLGNYTLAIDSIAPKISPTNFKDKQWLSKYRYLKLKITDNLSGIKSYRGEINGKWVLFEYEPKKNMLTYDFNDGKLEGNKHKLKLTVVDNVNNTNVYIATFNTK
ncbi:M23 family metallopeptidase [Aureibaculum sp. 2210JD6-5]|uniref:M23 family metallopeptidase n=1 Tax=Aureibaculum sp. 2210JD6-5 TaxID=3103957 RepID=UPI002AAE81A7|nr:M23 family metallopeptidase [Aureibaculum sp. 2210JD6-5]MDY7395427.1 M23 family metallopeptidase [Aureibaculum sp. 2210JD6-5]